MSQARVSITPADAWSDQRLTPLQCRLLGLIGSYLGKDHTAWPSQSTLAADLGVSRKAVNEGIKALVKYGYIRSQARHREDGGQTSSVYFVVMDPKDRGSLEGDTPCNPEVTPPLLDSDTPCNPMEVTPPVTSKGYTKKDPVKDPREDDTSKAFDAIWSCWSAIGRKRSKSRANCEAALARLGKSHDLKAITLAAQRYAKATSGDYHKGLHTWLSGGFYEQWMPSSPPQGQPQPTELGSDLERAFDYFARTGDWIGDRFGHPLSPNRPDAGYAPELYARFGISIPPNPQT